MLVDVEVFLCNVLYGVLLCYYSVVELFGWMMFRFNLVYVINLVVLVVLLLVYKLSLKLCVDVICVMEKVMGRKLFLYIVMFDDVVVVLFFGFWEVFISGFVYCV